MYVYNNVIKLWDKISLIILNVREYTIKREREYPNCCTRLKVLYFHVTIKTKQKHWQSINVIICHFYQTIPKYKLQINYAQKF